jgi:CPA1 family monovalent cation:H+ antiporter
VLTALPQPFGEDMHEVGYAELSARQLAARRAGEELDRFRSIPGIHDRLVEEARTVFEHWEGAARSRLGTLEQKAGIDVRVMHRRQAKALTKIAAIGALRELSSVGIISSAVAERAAERVEREIEAAGQ